jgi:hypothetical protein
MQRLKSEMGLILQEVKNTSDFEAERWDPSRLCGEPEGPGMWALHCGTISHLNGDVNYTSSRIKCK